MPDQKSDDVIDNVITSIDGVIALENIEKAEDVMESVELNVRKMLVEINKLKADKAILENELESYKADKSEWLDKRQAAAYRLLMDEMESESGANR